MKVDFDETFLFDENGFDESGFHWMRSVNDKIDS